MTRRVAAALAVVLAVGPGVAACDLSGQPTTSATCAADEADDTLRAPRTSRPKPPARPAVRPVAPARPAAPQRAGTRTVVVEHHHHDYDRPPGFYTDPDPADYC